MASNFGVVAYIDPPSLLGVTQPDLIKFETEYSAYKEKVENVNLGRAAGNKLPIATIRDCIDGTTLQALCILGKITGASTLEQATADKVEAWFTAAHTATPLDLSERVQSALASVTFKNVKADPAGAAFTFCLEVVKSLDKNNASDILSNPDKAKYVINKLENKLEPDLLRERVKMKRDTWTNQEKGDLLLFQECVSTLAVDVAQNEVARARIGGKRREPGGRSEKSGGKKEAYKSAAGASGDKPTENDADKHVSKKQKSKSSKAWTASCLNPQCKEKHRIKDCSITTAEQKKAFLDEYHEKKKSKHVKSIVYAATADCNVKTALGEGRYDILLEESVKAVALGDSGADVSIIPATLFNELQKRDKSVEAQILEKPLRLELACKSMHVQVTSSANVTVTIHLPGSNIPVRFRSVQFYVADFELSEVILGRPFLHSIGFNLDNHLKKLASARYSGLSYQGTDDDPIALPDNMAAGIGKDSEESIQKAFETIVKEADKNGISTQGKERVQKMLTTYRDVFRINLGPDKPAKVEPLKIQCVPEARPFKTPQRRYAPMQAAFIKSTISDLERVGAVRRNPSAKWASPAHAVPKPGSTKLRFTVDLRGVNARTVPVQSAMPHFESKLQEVAGSKLYAKMDLAHGYWQIPLAAESQDMMSIQTPLGVFTPNRLLQGGSDSGNHFQAVLQEQFSELNNLLQWIDDFLLHATTENELLDSIELFLQICQRINLKVHAEKTSFFCKEVTFCGRVISPSGIAHHPRHFESLLQMKRPTLASELQQLLCATNWMRTSIPAYAETIAPLHKLLEDAYKQAGKRTKAAVRKITIADSWGTEHDAAFSNIKNQLAAAVKLAHVKEEHRLCLFTDASETHWASILTQVPESQSKEDIEEQNHEPLCFLSGSFKSSSTNWSVPEKEGYAIVESMTSLDHIVMGREVNIFTDHANLVYLYDPQGRNPGMPRHTASKLMRWAMKLSAYRYVVEHLAGERNVWADMLTRWAVKPHADVQAATAAVKSLALVAPVNPGYDASYDQPDLKAIQNSQQDTKDTPPEGCTSVDGLWRSSKGALWIPDSDRSMKLRILIAAHTGVAGHRGQAVTLANVRAKFFWKTLGEDVKSFVESCLHCLCSASASTVPRPLGHALHATKPNRLLHFDFLYMTPGEGNLLYTLILKDDHSGYVWLVPTEAANAETAASALLRWFTTFGVVENWVSDRGSHFKNELVAQLREKLKVAHHFTLAYCPWSNGTVEVVCREVLRACRALLSELQLPHKCWPDVLPMIQSALNNATLPRLGNRCPQTAFTGLPQSNPICTLIKRNNGAVTVHSIEQVRMQQRASIADIQKALDEMHKEVAERTSRVRQRAVDAHNKKVGVRPVNFSEGDFVLRGVLQRERVKKPALRWNGPYRVLRCQSNYVFTIEHLLTNKQENVHGRRLKFFLNSSFDVTEDVKEHLEYQQGELLVVDRIDDIRKKQGVVELQVVWKGFGPDESDWVQLESMREDVPVLVGEALESFAETGTARQRSVVESI